MAIEAKVIADSLFKDTRLITLEIQLHRYILCEFNTHRMISRNFQSSRAVPVHQMIEQVENNPALPIHWGKNQSGMQAKEESNEDVGIYHVGGALEGDYSNEVAWSIAAKCAAGFARSFAGSGYHKQIVNRLLEPFMWTKGVVTTTERSWKEFLKLRLHPDAQPEICDLAEKIKTAIENSNPTMLRPGEWHLPYLERGRDGQGNMIYYVKSDKETSGGLYVKDAIKVSASCNAQVSYRRLDDSLEKAVKVYEMLNLPVNGVYPEDPPHFSPTEHIAKASDCDVELSGNFHSTDFIQYRKVLEKGLESKVIIEE